MKEVLHVYTKGRTHMQKHSATAMMTIDTRKIAMRIAVIALALLNRNEELRPVVVLAKHTKRDCQ